MTVSPIVPPVADLYLGLVVPFDMALDRELWRWTPEGVSLLFTRTPFLTIPVTVELAEIVGELSIVEQAVRSLSAVAPSAYAYGCTCGSFVHGPDGELRMAAAMSASGGAQAVTTSGALLAALAHLGVRRVATATPYDAAVTGSLNWFLQQSGLDVTGSAHLGLTGGIWKVPYEETMELVRRADRPDADAVVLPCTNLPTYDILAPLETELGKPVVSANQATMWAALGALGRQGVGPGQRLISAPLPGGESVAS